MHSVGSCNVEVGHAKCYVSCAELQPFNTDTAKSKEEQHLAGTDMVFKKILCGVWCFFCFCFLPLQKDQFLNRKDAVLPTSSF